MEKTTPKIENPNIGKQTKTKTKVNAISFIFLVVVFFSGAAIYQSLEEKHEWNKARNFAEYEEDFRLVVQNLNHSNVTELWNTLTAYADAAANSPDPKNPEWDLEGGIFYIFTVMTTIGFGTFCPKTWLGKVITIFYVFGAIPISFMALSYVTENFMWTFGKISQSCKIGENSKSLGKIFRTVLICLTALGIFPMLYALFYTLFFSWTYIDSWYSYIVTQTTIGLGDVTPTPNTSSDVQMVFFYFFTMFGLGVVGCVLKSIQEALQEQGLGKINQKIKEALAASQLDDVANAFVSTKLYDFEITEPQKKSFKRASQRNEKTKVTPIVKPASQRNDNTKETPILHPIDKPRGLWIP